MARPGNEKWVHIPLGLLNQRYGIKCPNYFSGIKRKVDQDVDAASSAKSKMSTVDLVVLGLSFSCDESTMREYFSQYGEVVRSEIKRDSHTGKSKGFGFIHFKDFDSQIQVLTKKHFIGGRLCEVKIPNEKVSISQLGFFFLPVFFLLSLACSQYFSSLLFLPRMEAELYPKHFLSSNNTFMIMWIQYKLWKHDHFLLILGKMHFLANIYFNPLEA